MKLRKKVLALACLAACTAGSAMALENVENSLQYAYGFNSSTDKNLGYGAESNKLETFRFQHESDYSLGSNFFLYDYVRSDKNLGGPYYGTNKQMNFMVVGTELHASKVLGKDLSSGIFKDIGLSVRGQQGSYYNYRGFEIGPQVHLNVPGFDKFKIAYWWKSKSDDSGYYNAAGTYVAAKDVKYADSNSIGIDWKTRWQMLGKSWTSQAFIRYQIKQNGGASKPFENASGIPERLWIEPDIFMEINKDFAVGLRAYYLKDSNNLDVPASSGGGENATKKSHLIPQVVLKVAF